MFKFLIITFVLIYVIARFAGYFFRLVFWLMGKRMEKEMKNQHKNEYKNPHDSTSKEGDINIIHGNSSKKGKKFTAGDYVDFEEI